MATASPARAESGLPPVADPLVAVLLTGATNGLPRRETIWDHEAPPIVAFNSWHRGILADGIDPRVPDSAEKRATLADFLVQDPPDGWQYLPVMASVADYDAKRDSGGGV